jgi:hypothetical protein
VTLDQFKVASDLASLFEVEKVCYLAFFYLKSGGTPEFTVADASEWLIDSGGAAPNQSRLYKKLSTSRNTIKGQRGFRLAPKFVQALETKFPTLSEKSQDVVDLGTILPEIEYKNSRSYVEKLAQQINASYENNIFDGCAVLTRRLVEVLLILSYQEIGIEDAIKDAQGNYQMLDGIIGNAKTNPTLALSRNSKTHLDVFRKLGNFSAHKIEYTCHREYIEPHIQDFRALITELLHKSGIRT